MITEKALRALKEQVFLHESETAFAILDGAIVPDLPSTLQSLDATYVCLYRGILEPDMALVAPYLAILKRDAPFTDWVLNGWGRHWGILGTSQCDFLGLRKHFRQFVMISGENGRPMYFRFYDPRVWRNCISIFDVNEIKLLFGPVTSFLVEDEDANKARVFTFVQNQLRDEMLAVKELPVSAPVTHTQIEDLPPSPQEIKITAQKLEQMDRIAFCSRLKAFLHAHCKDTLFMEWVTYSDVRNGLWYTVWPEVRHMSEHDCAMVLIYLAVRSYEGSMIDVKAEIMGNPSDHELHIKQFLSDGGYFRFSDFDLG